MQDIVFSSKASARLPVVQVHVGASKHVQLSSARLTSVASLFSAASTAAEPTPAKASAAIRPAHGEHAVAAGGHATDNEAGARTGSAGEISRSRHPEPTHPSVVRRLNLDADLDLDLDMDPKQHVGPANPRDNFKRARVEQHQARGASAGSGHANIAGSGEGVVQVDMVQVLSALRDGVVTAEDLTGLARRLQESAARA